MMKEKIMLWNPQKGINSYIRPYLLETDEPCGAVLITPGGGYQQVCEPSEGGPVAEKFNSLGLHAFVLNYRVFPNLFPAPQQDALRALKIIRGRAKEWKINPNQIGTCGFSAGGHLSASLGTTLVDDIDASDNDGYDAVSSRPDFIISGQGVLSFTEEHPVTSDNLLGKDMPFDERQKYAADCCVSPNTPPAFIWHTFSDQVVNFNYSIRFAQACKANHVPCELHIFPYGDHGILLGLDTPDVSQWPLLARNFIQTHTGNVQTPRENYTHLHQCAASHTYPGPWRKEP